MVEQGAGWGPRMAVVGITEEGATEGVREDVGEADGGSGTTSPAVRMEGGGEDTKGAAWAGGREGSGAGGTLEMLAVGSVEGNDVAVTTVTAGSVWDGA